MFRKTDACKVSKVSTTFFASSLLIAIVAQLFAAAPAQAQCTYEGQDYETGEMVGTFVCMPDGSWQQQ